MTTSGAPEPSAATDDPADTPDATIATELDADLPLRTSLRGHPGLIMTVVLVAQLILVLDSTIVNIALPKLKEDLGFSATSLSWVVDGYTLAFGGLLLLGARAGDILGRRLILLSGVIVFTAASSWAASRTTAPR